MFDPFDKIFESSTHLRSFLTLVFDKNNNVLANLVVATFSQLAHINTSV